MESKRGPVLVVILPVDNVLDLSFLHLFLGNVVYDDLRRRPTILQAIHPRIGHIKSHVYRKTV